MCHGMMLHESGVRGDAKRERDEADDAVVAGLESGFSLGAFCVGFVSYDT